MDLQEVCVFHSIENCNETLVRVPEQERITANQYANRWIVLERQPQESISEKLLQSLIYKDLVCHYACYKKFCNKLMIARVEMKAAREDRF